MPSFDAAQASFFGSFIDAAYTAFAPHKDDDPPVQTPAIVSLPTGYSVFRYVTMDDFLFGPGTQPAFYGFIARRDESNEYVLAIRGTVTGTEWWDNVHIWPLADFAEVPGGGKVSPGFHQVYQTLQLLPPPAAPDVQRAPPVPVDAGSSFAQKVSAAISPAKPPGAEGAPAGIGSLQSLVVTGHSLGAALATMFVLENAVVGQLHTPGVYTFASPRVGNGAFAGAYGMLDRIETWRIVNAPDVVPNTPPDVLGYTHVGAVKLYNSGSSTPSQAHALSTYEALLQDSVARPAVVAVAQAAPAAAPSDPNAAAAQMPLPIDASFEGAPAKAYRVSSRPGPILDATDDLDATEWTAGETPLLTLTPLFFNAPPFFVRRDKVNAYISLSMAQQKPQVPLDKQLRWALLAPLLTEEHQDIQSYDFSRLDDDVQAGLQNAPFPGGAGTIRLGLTAITGGTPSKAFQIVFDTFAKLRKIADPTVNPLASGLGIPAAALSVAAQYEALANQIVQAFTPGAHGELTFDGSETEFALLASAAADGVVNIPAKRSYLVFIPVQSNKADSPDGAQPGVVAYQAKIDEAVTAKTNFTVILPQGKIRIDGTGPNPFDNIPYLTVRADVSQFTS